MQPWSLDPNVIHLNHGSFGACPVPVLDEQRHWQQKMEANPVLFFTETLQPAIDSSRIALAEFVGADPDGLVFVPNATAGINSVLRSLEPSLGPGDEILITDHTYNACRNSAEVTALRTGAELVEVPLPFPLESADAYVDAILDRVSPQTQVVMVDAVTSPTALIPPIASIIEALEPAVAVLVDAAHAPGMIPVDVRAMGASYVVGNCHKWMCAPKSAGFLYAREDRRAGLIPASISHGWNAAPTENRMRLHELFDWIGTDDPSARLSVPAAIDTMGALHPRGWPGVMDANRSLALWGRNLICSRIDVPAAAPDEMIGAMVTIALPGGRGEGSFGDLDPMSVKLREDWGIEVPVFGWSDWPQLLLRFSAQLYNSESDYERLADALVAEIL